MGKDWTGNDRTIFATLGASNHTDKIRQAEDYYATDSIAIDKLLEVKPELHKNIWECACGRGDLSKRLEEYGYKVKSTDLIDRGYGKGGVDFLNINPDKRLKIDILTNPPYKCFDVDTECYSKRGWLKYNEIKNNDEILTINPKTQQIEWSTINKIIIRDFDENEKMYHFKKGHMDIMCTNEHRMYAFNKKDDCLEYRNNDLIKSGDIRSTHYIPRKGYSWVGEEKEFFVLPAINGLKYNQEIYIEEKYISMDNWLKFFGFWLADGCCRHTKNSNGNIRKTICIKQRKDNAQYVRDILNELPFVYYERLDDYDKINECVNFEINDQQLWNYLIQFGKSQEKYIPTDIKNISSRQLKILIDSYFEGDGSEYFNDGRTYRTTSYQLIIDIQEILLKLGILTHIISNKYIIADGIEKTVYLINVNPNSIYNKIYYPSNKNDKCACNYQGKVWCLTLNKNQIFLLRRNGFEFISGNCAKEFVEKALDIVDDGYNVYMFLKLQFLESKGRRTLFDRKELKTVYVSSNRILCAKNADFDGMRAGGGSAVAYAFFHWQKGYCGDPIIKWIN